MMERSGGDVDGDVPGGGGQVVEEQAGFEAAAAAVFDQQAVGAEKADDGVEVVAEDRELGARGVVFVELADLFEEVGAALVVEVFAGEMFMGVM